MVKQSSVTKEVALNTYTPREEKKQTLRTFFKSISIPLGLCMCMLIK